MFKIPFNCVALTMRNGKTRPNTAKHNQRWIPTMTNAAIRSDWMKSSLLRVAPAPPGNTGDSINYVCIKKISSVWTIMQCVMHILGPPQKKRMKTMIKAAATYGAHWLESCMTTISFTYLCILTIRRVIIKQLCLHATANDSWYMFCWYGIRSISVLLAVYYHMISNNGPMTTPYFLNYPRWCRAMWIVLWVFLFYSNLVEVRVGCLNVGRISYCCVPGCPI